MKKAILLFSFLVIVVSSCKKNDNNEPTGEVPQFQGTAANKTIITTKDGLLVKVNAATGAAETVFNFGNYNDASGFDYDNGMVFIGDESNTINAVDLNSKTLKWRTTFQEEESITASDVQVVVKDNVCYTVGYSGIVAAVNPENGSGIWKFIADPDYTGERNQRYPTFMSVVGDKVVVGSAKSVFYDEDDRNYIHLLERATGKLLWTVTLPAEKYVSGKIKISGNTMLVPMGNLVALNTTNGQKIWEVEMPGAGWGSGDPVIAGDRVIVHGATSVGLGGKLFCLNLADGSKIWDLDAGMDVVGRFTPTVIDNKYVLGFYENGTSRSANGMPFLVHLENGQKIWENEDMGMDSDGTYANGKLYFFGQNFNGSGTNVGLICLNAGTGQQEWINTELNGLANIDPLVIADNGVFRSPTFH